MAASLTALPWEKSTAMFAESEPGLPESYPPDENMADDDLSFCTNPTNDSDAIAHKACKRGVFTHRKMASSILVCHPGSNWRYCSQHPHLRATP